MLARAALYAAAAALAVAWVIASGCHSNGRTGSSPPPTPPPAAASPVGNWKLDQLPGVDLAGMYPPGTRYPMLSIAADGKVSGFSGVNQYSSSLDMAAASRGEFRLTPVASTRMAGTPEAMNVESRFLAALQSATGFKADAGRLTLMRGGEAMMGFARAK